jgi:hypothetical protein
MEEVENLRREIDSKNRVLKQLEGVYKTSTSLFQRRRVAQEMRDVKSLIRDLRGKLLIRRSEEEYAEQETREVEEHEFSILRAIPVQKYREDSRDREIDEVISYVDFFEKYYLPILSDYYIKLDFSHAIKRDTFYPRHMEIKKALKEYDYELDILNREEFNRIAHTRDKSVIHKLRQRYMLLLDRFFKDLRAFLDSMLDDLQKGGNIIINPYDQVNLSEFEHNRRLDGRSVAGLLEEMKAFSGELTRYLSLPNM